MHREIDLVDQLDSNSLEDINSCSSSILNTSDREDMYVDDDDYDDGINVTLLSSSVTMDSKTEFAQNNTVEKELNASATAKNCTYNSDINGDIKLPSSVVDANDQKRKRLNGAAKKKFRYLVDHGHSRDEARVLAEKPFRILQTDPAKRRRNADLSESTSSDTNPPKRLARHVGRGQTSEARSSVQNRLAQARMGGSPSDSKEAAGSSGPHKPLYSEVAGYIRIGVLPEGFPHTELTTQQLIATQNEILKKVAEQRKERIKPKFGNCMFRPGHMIILCKNQDTVDWLKAKISSIKPWENAGLIALEEKDIPRPEILVGFFPRSEKDSNEEILAFVESQNEGLVVDTWRILKRYTVKQHHVELFFTVDAVSMRSLEDCKFTIDYKFGVAYIRKRNQKTDSTANEQNEVAISASEDLQRDKAHPKKDSEISSNLDDAEMTEPHQTEEESRNEIKELKGQQNVDQNCSETREKVVRRSNMPKRSLQVADKEGKDHHHIQTQKQQHETMADKTAYKSTKA